MISSEKKNKASAYRRLKDMTQQDVADILNTVKSNVANMESEDHSPSEAYRKILGLTPRELTAPLLSMGKALCAENILHYSVAPSENSESFLLPKRKEVFEKLGEISFSKGYGSHLQPIGEAGGTDIYAWQAYADFPSEKIKKGEVFAVVPKLYYNDGVLLLCRETLSKYTPVKLAENGTVLLSLTDDEQNPNIAEVEIIGEIIKGM